MFYVCGCVLCFWFCVCQPFIKRIMYVYTPDTPDFVVTSSWHPRVDVTRMLYEETASVEFQINSTVDLST